MVDGSVWCMGASLLEDVSVQFQFAHPHLIFDVLIMILKSRAQLFGRRSLEPVTHVRDRVDAVLVTCL